MTQSQDTPNPVLPTDGTQQIERTNLGQFVRGISGNPKGRPRGSKNRTTLIKQAMEEALTRDMAGALDIIVDNVIQMAIEGDKDMIKLLIGDVLKEVRRNESAEEERSGNRRILVNISQFFGEDKKRVADALEAEFHEIGTTPKE